MKQTTVEAQMLIRKPAAEVYEAFADPALTTHFWFTRSDGRLEPGKSLTWEWEMYQVSTPVRVLEMTPIGASSSNGENPPPPCTSNSGNNPAAAPMQ